MGHMIRSGGGVPSQLGGSSASHAIDVWFLYLPPPLPISSWTHQEVLRADFLDPGVVDDGLPLEPQQVVHHALLLVAKLGAAGAGGFGDGREVGVGDIASSFFVSGEVCILCCQSMGLNQERSWDS